MSVVVLYRIVNAIGDGWMLPPNQWYHGHPTFSNVIEDAKVCTLLECEDYLARPDMPPGAEKQAVLPI